MKIQRIRFVSGLKVPKSNYLQAIPLYMKSDEAVFRYFRDHSDDIDAITGDTLIIPLAVEVESGNAAAVASIFSPGMKDKRYPGLMQSDLPCFWLEDGNGGTEIIRLPDNLADVNAYLRAITDGARERKDAKSVKSFMNERLKIAGSERSQTWRILFQELNMTKSTEKLIAVISGVIFVAAILAMAVIFPNPTAFQYQVFRIVLAGALAGFVSMTPGFLEITISNWVRAGGALAVFVIVYFYNPASLIAVGSP